MKSYIKLWGPSILKGLEKLEELANELSMRSEEAVAPKIGTKLPYVKGIDIIPKRSVTTMGEYDFVMEWNREPTLADIKELIGRIDKALAGTGCMYSITTKI